MRRKLLSLLLAMVMVMSLYATVSADTTGTAPIKGSLVIVGGALESSNAEVYNKFIELAGGKDNAKIAIIPAASSKPSKYMKLFKEDLKAYGVPENNVQFIEIALKDDSSTKDLDESKWADNANKEGISAQIKGCTGIWFVGGDQTRIVKALRTADGKDTKALDAVWEVYRNGGVIGGTSAGAAIMSETMIGGGSSLGALTSGFTDVYIDSDQQEYGPAYIEKGLGFFQYGIVDQHFDRKARLGRLTVVAYPERDKFPYAYGVDENTAMVVNNQTKSFEVVGRGGVTVVDLTKAVKNPDFKQTAMKDIMISYFETGDSYNMTKQEFKINPKKLDTKGYEEYEIAGPLLNTGVLSPNAMLKKFIGFDLTDNAAVNEIKSYLYGSDGNGFELVFRKMESTNGYWSYLDNGTYDHYSFINVAMDINPIKVTIEQLDKKSAATKENKANTAKEYTVKAGDMLWKIAKQFGVELEYIIKANNLKNPGQLIPGQKLVIPQ